MFRSSRWGFRFVLMALLALVVSGTGQLFAAPAHQEQTIAYDETVAGMISSKRPEVRYQFVAQQGDRVTISLQATSAELDPELRLLDENGNQLAVSDDVAFPDNRDSLIQDFAIPAAGTYTIVATGFADTFGQYELTLSAEGAGPALPTPVPGGALSFILTWSGAADLDLVVTDPADSQIYWETPTSPTGGVLDSSEGNDFCETISPQPQEIIAWERGALPGEYFLHVQISLPCDTTGPVPFTLTVEADGQVLATYEEAAPSEGMWQGAFNHTGGQPAPPTGALRFILTWGGPADMDLMVTDPAGNEISWSAPTSPTGGALDSSQGNDFCETISERPQEIVAWESNAPAGEYAIWIQPSLDCEATGPVSFAIVAEVDGLVVDSAEETVPLDSYWEGTYTYEGTGLPQPTPAAQGALRLIVTWTGAADLDLMVTDPAGNEISWTTPTSPTGGALDSSQGNDFCETVSEQPQELVAWESNAPLGDYAIWIQPSLDCGATEPVPFTLTVEVDGQRGETVQEDLPFDSHWEGTYTYQGPGGGQPQPTPAPGGALRFILTWAGAADLDLGVTDPADNLVYWDTPTSPTGGALDPSQGNDYCETISPQPQEIIAWQSSAPPGEYIMAVQISLPCDTTGPVPFTLTVEADGKVVATYEEIAPSEGIWQSSFELGAG